MFLKLSKSQRELLNNWPCNNGWYTCAQLNDELSFPVHLQTLNALANKFLEIDDTEYIYAWDANNGIKLDAKTQVKYRRIPGKAY